MAKSATLSTRNPATANELRNELDERGCEVGRAHERRLVNLETCYVRLEGRLDRLIWAMVVAAVGLGTSAIMLGLNLALTFAKP